MDLTLILDIHPWTLSCGRLLLEQAEGFRLYQYDGSREFVEVKEFSIPHGMTRGQPFPRNYE